MSIFIHLKGGVPGPVRGWGLPQCLVGYHRPPPVNRMTNRCNNITLATTSLRPVKIQLNYNSVLYLVRVERYFKYQNVVFLHYHLRYVIP